MPQTYAFQVSMPVTDTLPRNRFSNTIHLEHTIGSIADTDLGSMCDDIIELWQVKYANAANEVMCKAYDVDAVPNYPRATRVVNVGTPWQTSHPREIALVLSYSGTNAGNKNERGRIYLAPQLTSTGGTLGLRPTQAVLDWALGWYTTGNASLPDLGGVDWKFGVWSRNLKDFTQTQKAWCNDDWDVVRSRGLRESTRVTATREG
jgi:hypothetical protein